MPWLSRFRLAPKLIGSFIMVAALAGIVGFAGLRGLQETQTQLHHITSQTIPAVVHLKAADGAVHETIRDSRGAILSSTGTPLAAQLRREAGTNEAEALSEFAAFTRIPSDSAAEAALTKRTSTALRAWQKLDAQAVHLDSVGNDQAATRLSLVNEEQVAQTLLTNFDALTALDEQQIAAATTQADNAHDMAIMQLSIVTALAIALAVVFGTAIARAIARPVRAVQGAAERLARDTMADLERAMHALARGDLEAAHARPTPVPVEVGGRDEVGAMARSFAAMQTAVGSIVSSLDGAREGLRAARDELQQRNDTLTREVAEREEAQRALSASEQRLRDFVENLPIGILVYSPEPKMTFCNSVAAVLFGLDPTNVLGVQPWTGPWQRLREDGTALGEGEGPIAQAAATKQPVHDFILGLITAAKPEPVWVSITAVPQFDGNGQMTEIIVVCTDISERYAAAAALRRSEAQFRTFIEEMPVAAMLISAEGQILYWNSTAATILDIAADTLPGMDITNDTWWAVDEHGVRVAAAETPAARALASHQAVRSNLVAIMTARRSEPVWCEVTAILHTDTAGQFAGLIVTFMDITDRRNAQQALERSEERFRTFIEDMPVGGLLFGPDNQLLYGNHIALDLIGIDADTMSKALQARNAWWLVDADGTRLEYHDWPLVRARSAGQPLQNALIGILNQDRTEPTWCEASATPRFDDDGQYAGAIIILVDISLRRQAEAKNALYAEMLRHLPIGFTAWQPDVIGEPHSLRLVATNEATSRYAGRPMDTMIGQTIDECYPGALEADANDSYRVVLRSQQPVRLGEFPYVDAAGEPAVLSVLLFALPNQALGVLTEDVTDRKRAAESAEHLSAIVESSTDAIIGKTLDGVITSWNHGAEVMYGYTNDEVVGRPISMLVLPDRPDEVPSILRRIRLGEHITQLETTRVRKDGVVIDVALTISPIRDEHGTIIGASTIARDVTDQKRADARIRQQIRQLSALRAIDVSITGSYDMRISLNVVLEQVIACLGVDAASVLLLDPTALVLTHAASRGFRDTEIGRTRLQLGQGLAGVVALDRQRVGYPDLPLDRFDRKQWIVAEGFTSYFAAPLRNKGQMLGVLELFTRTRLTPDDDWYAFLDAIADQAAIAVNDAAQFVNLQRSNLELRLAYDATIEGWSRALDLRDHETEGHSRRVTDMTLNLARRLGFDEDAMLHVRRGALLHDIGKLGVPDGILLKPGPLTDDEWVIMRKHPTYAYELLQPIKYLRDAMDIPHCHHEKWDGSGYPRGLTGVQIPLAARAFAMVDVWDALSSDRPYRKGWHEERVRAHITAGSGSHFDPDVVAAFLAMDWPARADANATEANS